jgi:hypothetical protein
VQISRGVETNAHQHRVTSPEHARHADRRKADGYIAVAECSDLGSEYILYFRDKEYFVAVSDCLNEQDNYVLRKKYVDNQGFASENKSGNYHWIVDIDKNIWGDAPKIPTIVGIKKIKGIDKWKIIP